MTEMTFPNELMLVKQANQKSTVFVYIGSFLDITEATVSYLLMLEKGLKETGLKGIFIFFSFHF